MERILELTKPLSLYERLGKDGGITQIVDDALEAHMNNPQIQNIFTPYKEDPDRLATVRQQTIDFFSNRSKDPDQRQTNNGSTEYFGINLTAHQYMCVVDDVLNILEEREVKENSKKDMLAILWSLKSVIIDNN